jgi:hypothetical protein
MTPLEALNYLNELREKAKDIANWPARQFERFLKRNCFSSVFSFKIAQYRE